MPHNNPDLENLAPNTTIENNPNPTACGKARQNINASTGKDGINRINNEVGTNNNTPATANKTPLCLSLTRHRFCFCPRSPPPPFFFPPYRNDITAILQQSSATIAELTQSPAACLTRNPSGQAQH